MDAVASAAVVAKEVEEAEAAVQVEHERIEAEDASFATKEMAEVPINMCYFTHEHASFNPQICHLNSTVNNIA